MSYQGFDGITDMRALRRAVVTHESGPFAFYLGVSDYFFFTLEQKKIFLPARVSAKRRCGALRGGHGRVIEGGARGVRAFFILNFFFSSFAEKSLEISTP